MFSVVGIETGCLQCVDGHQQMTTSTPFDIMSAWGNNECVFRVDRAVTSHNMMVTIDIVTPEDSTAYSTAISMPQLVTTRHHATQFYKGVTQFVASEVYIRG